MLGISINVRLCITASPSLRSISTPIRCFPAIPMALRSAPKVCACSRPPSSTIPTATEPNAFAARCFFLNQPERGATMPNLPKALAVSKLSTGNLAGRCASPSIAMGRSTTPSTTSAPPVNASIVRLKPSALNDQKCAMDTRSPISIP